MVRFVLSRVRTVRFRYAWFGHAYLKRTVRTPLNRHQRQVRQAVALLGDRRRRTATLTVATRYSRYDWARGAE
ncbi:hypothetical protein EVAR_39068_1 [Eumeta japonica]|uniref:Uncharacterized protein n=1 Tax=Eumeta variegata TaxID=151549 RepID=A0A4C1WQZ8_EUMVA|nr:hypothetical protein EVAR_39068_1 [Eumeta japonica]